MIELGIIDPDVTPSAVSDYFEVVKKVTRQDWGDRLRGEENDEWVSLRPSASQDSMTVREVQQILRDAGFCPGSQVDGICGYRTRSALRLFQEYVRARDPSIGVPDGVAGPKTFGHLAKWRDESRSADWAATVRSWEAGGADPEGGEYGHWLQFLGNVQRHYVANPNAVLKAVVDYAGPSDTARPADWDFDRRHVHLVGIRTMKKDLAAAEERTFNDVMALLIKGLVFKFQCSTDPGHTGNPRGAPFLVPGQHDYHFGWHMISAKDRSYQALKPVSFMTSGVLVVRSKDDFVLSDADLAAGLEVVPDINVHWGGAGGRVRTVKRWSEGCQVITGAGYINHRGEPIDCSGFAAYSSGNLGGGKTRGAYNVLCDLVAALSGEGGGLVKYTLLLDEDVAHSAEVSARVGEARELAARMMR